MANEVTGIAAGLAAVQYGFLDSTGFFLSSTSTTTAPAAGNTNGSLAGRLVAGQEFPVQIPEGEVVPIVGDNIYQGGFIFPFASAVAGTLTVARKDGNFNTLIQNVTTTAVGDFTAEPLGVDVNNLAAFWLMVTSDAQATGGLKRFHNQLWLYMQSNPLYRRGWTQRAAGQFAYQLIASRSSTLPWGQSFVFGTQQYNSALAWDFFTDNPVTMQRFTGNAVATTFTLARTPAAATGGKVQVWIGGTQQTYTTNYTVSGTTLTFVAAPANNAKIVVFYEVTAL